MSKITFTGTPHVEGYIYLCRAYVIICLFCMCVNAGIYILAISPPPWGKRRKKKREKEKRKRKGKKRMERDKKWIRVLKGKIILSLFCFPVFGYVP